MQNINQALDVLKSPADYSLEAVSAALRLIRLKDDPGVEITPNTTEAGGHHECICH